MIHKSRIIQDFSQQNKHGQHVMSLWSSSERAALKRTKWRMLIRSPWMWTTSDHSKNRIISLSLWTKCRLQLSERKKTKTTYHQKGQTRVLPKMKNQTVLTIWTCKGKMVISHLKSIQSSLTWRNVQLKTWTSLMKWTHRSRMLAFDSKSTAV